MPSETPEGPRSRPTELSREASRELSRAKLCGTLAISSNNRDVYLWTLVVLSAALVSVIYATVPFLMMPTMGQAVWLGGFAESMSAGPFMSLRADEIGSPGTHIPAFGYTGALPMSWLIEVGFSLSTAYTLSFTGWLAFAGTLAYKLSRMFGATRRISVLYVTAWLSLPIGWAHVDYSFLPIGLMFLPGYIFAAFKVLDLANPLSEAKTRKTALGFILLAIFAVFTDGYSFMMFATAFGILFAHDILTQGSRRRELLLYTLPIAAVGFGLAYALYSLSFDSVALKPANVDFFRGWGLDITYLFRPVENHIWLFDALGLSESRPPQLHYGDSSLSYGSFTLPLFACAAFAVWRNKTFRRSLPLILIAFAGVYMSLGPSFKFNTQKTAEQSLTMPADAAGPPTGTGILSAHVPGFNNMRASYRWIALGQAALWCAMVLSLSSPGVRRSVRIGLPVLLMVTTLPNISKRSELGTRTEAKMNMMAQELSFLGDYLKGFENVLFYPHSNDFGANYLAPHFGFDTYNIGGDKNYAIARQAWPETILAAHGRSDPAIALPAIFAEDSASAVVVPTFDLLGGIHVWPPPRTRQDVADRVARLFTDRKGYKVIRNDYATIVLPVNRELIVADSANRILEVTGLPFHTQTGIFSNTGFLSSEGRGYALFGPYIPLPKGTYDVSIIGETATPNLVKVDAASSKGTLIHFARQLVDPNGEVLCRFRIMLEEDVEDIEIRVLAATGHHLRIRQVRIEGVVKSESN